MGALHTIGVSYATSFLPEAKVALDLLRGLPQRALNLIRSSGFNGADLVRLENDVSRPSFRDQGLKKSEYIKLNLIVFKLRVIHMILFQEIESKPDYKPCEGTHRAGDCHQLCVA